MYRYIILWAALAAGGYAQQIPIERLEIALWPEYDDPRLLVIYRGELAADPQGPLVFAIPITAQVHAVAHVGPDGGLLTSEWELLPGDTTRHLVLFTPGSRRFQFEYYDDVIGISSERTFVFRFQSDRYEVNNLEIEVQQPLRASGLVGDPPLEPQGSDTRGLSYFGRKVGAVPRGTLIEQRVRYTKTDIIPSVVPAQKLSLVWVALGAGVALVALSIVGFLWMRRKQFVSVADSRRPSARFCARCGRRFHADEQFCPQCGQRRSP